jgi:Glycosyl hydrolases family 2, TIM barrel domain/Glycosyl hydrolases family 2/Glycosyl hydrolases family 2, sugar binding domain
MTLPTPHPPAIQAPARDFLSLDGVWDFRHETHAQWQTAVVPGFWQAQFKDLAVAFGAATYARDITVPAEWLGRQVALCFGAVSDTAIVRLDGVEVGRHQGGYLPFEIVLPDTAVGSSHRLEIETFLPNAHRPAEGADFAEIPHGKQSWYGPQAGIWQSVTLMARARQHISALRLDPHWADKRLDIEVGFSLAGEGNLHLAIYDPSGVQVYDASVPFSGSSLRYQVPFATIQAWSPDQPALYSLRATLLVDGRLTDERADTFGFRQIEARDGMLWLNGEPLYLRGALDQDYYPDGFGAPPSLALLEDQAHKAKAMGLNCLRCHIKVPDPRYYEVADRLGLLIWTEIPNIETFTPASAARLRETMEGILARDRNHPSIVVWTIINEDWGTRLREVAEQRAWLSDMVDWLHSEDPLRLVVDNSACFPNWHVKTDINDYHYYRTTTDRFEEWNALNEEFAVGASWTFGTGPDISRKGDEPLIVSEFGVWGLPQPDLLRENDRDPWWMAYGATWADGVALPQGIEARFGELGLSQVFGSFSGFIDAVQWHQWMNLKHEIEVMRRHSSIAGYVITEFTDVHWEGNGLLDMARNPRVFVPAMPKVNADVVISPGAVKHAVYAGDNAEFEVTVSTGGTTVPEGAKLEWSCGQVAGEHRLPKLERMQVVPLTVTTSSAPSTSTGRLEVAFRLVAPDGTVLSQNEETISTYAQREAVSLTCASDDDAICERLTALGYSLSNSDQAHVLVTRTLDADLVERIHAGAHVLQLVDKSPGRLRDDLPPRDGPMSINIEDNLGGMQSGSYFTFPGYQLVNRHRSIWRGDWVGNFSWLRRDGCFSHLPGGPLFDLSFANVVPLQLMTGLRPWEFQGRVHAGVVVGWVHKPGAYIIEKRLGRGKLVATTFRLHATPPDQDPVATAIYDGLLGLATVP